MITAQIPMTSKASAASSTLSIDEFIEYTIKNDLNIVTTKWLAHSRRISISEARNALKSYWDVTGKVKGFCATFSVLVGSNQEGFQIKLVDNQDIDKLRANQQLLSVEIYAIHAVPLKDRKVQLGIINVPIYDVIGEIETPGIDASSIKIPPPMPVVEDLSISENHSAVAATDDNSNNSNVIIKSGPQIEQSASSQSESISQQPPSKKMKLVKKTRTFMQNGYEMVEHYNEMVPCEDGDEGMEGGVKDKETQQPAVPAAQTKSKQSSMMSFFKKK